MSDWRFDPARLADLYATHHGELFRYAHRYTGDADAAEDFVQEAFIRLAEHPPAHDHALRAWLFRAVTTIAVDSHRSRSRQQALAVTHTDALPMGRAGGDPGIAAEQSDIRTRVRAALDELEPRDRAILLMREEGFTHREIAEAVGTTTQSVGTMLARALAKLARRLPLQASDT